MVNLDHGLIRIARALTTAANVHRASQAIFLYELAVQLHNGGAPGHVYDQQYERQLRGFVKRESDEATRSLLWVDQFELAERNPVAMDRARKVLDLAQRMDEKCMRLDDEVNYALSLGRSTARPVNAVKKRTHSKKKRV